VKLCVQTSHARSGGTDSIISKAVIALQYIISISLSEFSCLPLISSCSDVYFCNALGFLFIRPIGYISTARTGTLANAADYYLGVRRASQRSDQQYFPDSQTAT
jgi:hypothetical protein